MALAYSHGGGAGQGGTLRWQDFGARALPGLVPGVRDRRLKAALAGHPVFHPPCPFSGQHLADNFAYFLAQRQDRVAHLRFFLRTLGVDVDDDGAVDRWVAQSGAALVPGSIHAAALRTHEPLWAREFAGLNIVLDIAVALGEAAIGTRKGWRWEADADATGACAVLTDGGRRIDIVARVAACCSSQAGRNGGLAAVRAALGEP